MTNEDKFRRRRVQHDEFSRTRYINDCVDAAVAPLGRYLSRWQVRLVRSIVEASIEADPVARRLIANALRTRLRSYRGMQRAKGAAVKLKHVQPTPRPAKK
jgi:hypothetical protein